jgi:membrane protease YdiL (CAAX protease family)
MNKDATEAETSILTKHSLALYFVLSYAIMIFGIALILFIDVQEFFGIMIALWSPTISAIIISGIIGGEQEIKQILQGFLIWRIHPKWYFGALFILIAPLIFGVIYALMGFDTPGINPLLTPISFMLGLLNTLHYGPLSEEAGWRGFALPRLQEKYNALTSSVILGVLWACWHLPLYIVQTRMSFFIYLPLVIALSILFTWLYNNTKGSLIIAIIVHFCANFGEPLIVRELGLIPQNLFFIVGGILLIPYLLLVIAYFGPSKLSRKPDSELPFTRES